MNKSFNGLGRLIRESLNKLIPFMPFDFAQESLVEGLNQSFLRLAVIERVL